MRKIETHPQAVNAIAKVYDFLADLKYEDGHEPDCVCDLCDSARMVSLAHQKLGRYRPCIKREAKQLAAFSQRMTETKAKIDAIYAEADRLAALRKIGAA